MPEGYVIKTGTGQWGNLGNTSNLPAMDREVAEEFLRRLAQDTGRPPEDYELVQIEAKHVEGRHSSPSIIDWWEHTGFGSKGVEKG